MKILIVGMLDSVHLAKWVSLVNTAKHKLVLFPSSKYKLHDKLKQCNVTIAYPGIVIRFLGRLFGNDLACDISRVHERISRFVLRNQIDAKERSLAKVIKRERPDLVHSMETQKAGYLVLTVKEKHSTFNTFPLWLHTNWGSDIYLFGRLKEHKTKISKVITECDYYSCESRRDQYLAKDFGYSGVFFQPFPNSCGFDIDEIKRIGSRIKTSNRKLVVIKGYQGWSGRALTALRAIQLIAPYLADYKIIVYSAERQGSVEIESELISEELMLNMEVITTEISHEKMLELFSNARLYIGIAVSDGISTSMLEAMALGAFPIQSDTSTASEWIVDGETGFIVSPYDPAEIAERIRRAVTDEILVDTAAIKNLAVIRDRADSQKIKIQIDNMYSTIETTGASRSQGSIG